MKEKIKYAIKNGEIFWKKHSLQRMMERGISRKEVSDVLLHGKVIEKYKDDKPFASYLMAYLDNRPLHVVFSYDELHSVVYIITTYEPSTKYFEKDLMRRKSEKE